MTAAISTVIFDGYGFEEGLAMLAACGVPQVEPAFIEGYTAFSEATFTEANGRALAGVLAADGLGAPAVSAHMDLGSEGAADALLRRLDYAVGLGAPVLVTNATSADRGARLLGTLERTLPRFAEAGVTLALENPGHGAGALLPDGAAAARLVAEVGHTRLRANYDLCNAVTYSGGAIDAAADLSRVLPVACRVHLKDVRAAGPDWLFCPPGDGSIDYDGLFAAVPASALPPVTVEHPIRLWRPRRGDPVRRAERPEPEAVAAAVARSVAFLSAHGLAGGGR